MEFISLPELRAQPDRVWQQLAAAEEMIVTVDGQPVALLAGVTGDTLEFTLKALRRARVQLAVSQLRANAQASGASQLSASDIEAEIQAAHQTRRAARGISR